MPLPSNIHTPYAFSLGSYKPIPKPQPKAQQPSFWQQTIDNTFGSSKGHGDIYKMTVGLNDVPGAVGGFIGNVAKGGYHGIAGAVDELTGNYAGSAEHARAAKEAFSIMRLTLPDVGLVEMYKVQKTNSFPPVGILRRIR